MLNTCMVCGKGFEAPDSRNQLCSAVCKAERRAARERAAYAAMTPEKHQTYLKSRATKEAARFASNPNRSVTLLARRAGLLSIAVPLSAAEREAVRALCESRDLPLGTLVRELLLAQMRASRKTA